MTLSYKNPLDDFASYSVHYVMLATRTTEDARVFVDAGQNAGTLAAIEKVQLIGDVVPYSSSSNAYLIMDTRRFSQFTIEKLKYDVSINGLTSGKAVTNFATYIELTILDSVGISFINFLQWLVNEKMQTSFSGMVFMLRVIFVGHHPDGSTETVQSVTLPLMMDKIELNLEFSKGVYTCTCIPYTNFDAFQQRRWLNIANATQYYTGLGNNTLGAVIDSFERRLNAQSEAYFERASTELKRAGRLKNTEDKYGRLVRYQLTIPQKWESMIFTGGGTANATETNHKTGSTGQPLDTHVNVPVGMQITEVLDLILKQVKEIADLGAGRKVQGEGGFVTFYKHIVSLSSTDQHVTVHVDVVPFKVPNVYLAKNRNVIAQDQDDQYQLVDGARVPKNYFELDYIFTGKNTQILNFDMKFQDLNVFIRSNLGLGADALEGITALAQKGVLDPNQKVDTTAELVQLRAFDPILMPRSTEDELNNFRKFSDQKMAERGKDFKQASQDYTKNLSMFYAGSPVIAALTVKGNPLIMDKFNIGDFVPRTQAPTGTKGGSKDTYRKDFEAKILRNNTREGATESDLKNEGGVFTVNSPLGNGSYTTAPVFFKVNINGPNVNYATSETVNGEEFSKAVLYQNYYTVMSVSNVIEGGNFTQNLVLWSHNIYGYGKITPSSAKEPRAVK